MAQNETKNSQTTQKETETKPRTIKPLSVDRLESLVGGGSWGSYRYY
jgi:hypothetical protein